MKPEAGRYCIFTAGAPLAMPCVCPDSSMVATSLAVG